MYCLYDFRVSAFEFTDIGLSVFYVLINFFHHITHVIACQRERFLKFVNDLFTGLHKNCAGFIDEVHFMDSCTDTVPADERRSFETQIPIDSVEVEESAKDIEVTQPNSNLIVSDVTRRVQQLHAILRKLPFFIKLPNDPFHETTKTETNFLSDVIPVHLLETVP